VTKHLLITGKVQGVFFRTSLKTRADEMSIVGWTRNLPDGSVEAVLQGEDKLVAILLDWCYDGPRGARVDSIKVTNFDSTPSYHDFVILP
jgi:acylphosphatase